MLSTIAAKGLKNKINSFLPQTLAKSVQLTQLPDTTQLTCQSLHPDANKAIMTINGIPKIFFSKENTDFCLFQKDGQCAY